MSLDLTKTQFLTVDGSFGPTLKTYRRKRSLVLFGKDKKPMREIGACEWQKLQSDWPDEVKADGLHCRWVWTLIEVKANP